MRVAPLAALLLAIGAPGVGAAACAPAKAAAAAPAAAPTTIALTGLSGTTLQIGRSDLADLPRASVDVGTPAKTYEGPTLTAVLRLAGAPTGPRLHGAPVKDYVVITGADGFAAVFSLAETDAYLHKGTVILADTAAGAPLAAHEGPWRLVVEGDAKPARSVRNVVKIEVRAAP